MSVGAMGFDSERVLLNRILCSHLRLFAAPLLPWRLVSQDHRRVE